MKVDFVEEFFYGASFDDISIRPRRGHAKSRQGISLSTKLSNNIELNLPIVSANMDTVTGPAMCIEMALWGGIGFLPRAKWISIEQQVDWVKQVKRARNIIIEDPYFLIDSTPVSEAKRLMEQTGVGTFLVVNVVNKFVGLVTRKILEMELNDAVPIKNHLIKNVPCSDILPENKEDARRMLLDKRVEFLPLVSGARLKGLITASDIISFDKHPWASRDSEGKLRVGAAIGVNDDYMERASELIRAGVDVIVIDVAHGHQDNVLDASLEFRQRFPTFELICGNVATGEGARFCQDEVGAQGVKVGIGASSACRTRIDTGVGVPQIQAIREAWRAVHIPIIADAGIRVTGDIPKALITGADTVMLGFLLAGTDETPGPVVEDPKEGAVKIYRGMTAVDSKFSGGDHENLKNIEGQSVKIRYKGSVGNILARIRQNLQSTFSYVGCRESFAEILRCTREDYLLYLNQQKPGAIKESNDR